MDENGGCSEGTEDGRKVEDEIDCQLDGQWVKQGDGWRKPLLEGGGGEADGDTVVDIMKDVKGEDIGRWTSGTAMGTAVGLWRRGVGDAVSDVTGGCWEGTCVGRVLDKN